MVTNTPIAPGVNQKLPVSTHPNSRILVVDDDAGLRVSLTYILQHWGFEVSAAQNGLEATAITHQQPFQLIIMDIQMPMMDGVRALSLIRRDMTNARTPVIMLTQMASMDVVKKAGAMGISGFIVKQGFNPAALFDKIESILNAAAKNPQSSPDLDQAPPATQSAAAPQVVVKSTSPLSAAPARPADPAFAPDPSAGINQQAWKERVNNLGKQDKDLTRTQLSEIRWPDIVPGMLDKIEAEFQGSTQITEPLIRLVEFHPILTLRMLQHANQSRENSKVWAEDLATSFQWIGRVNIGRIIENQRLEKHPAHSMMIRQIHRWWRHSMAVAAVAGELAAAVEVPAPVARIAGMLHDLGRLGMLCSGAAPKLIACYDLVRNMTLPTAMAEQMLLGMNHKQAGHQLACQFRLSPFLAQAAQWHDMDDSQIGKLAENEKPLAAVLCAANQIAKAGGFGSFGNDELSPLPGGIVQAVTELELQIDHALEEVRRTAAYHLGAADEKVADSPVVLNGITITFLSPRRCVWNPYRRCLVGAGATLTDVTDPKAVAEKPPLNDLLVIDQTQSSLSTAMPNIRRLRQSPALAATPMLLLARRSDDPETVISQSNLNISIYSTPIRSWSLAQAVKKLVGS